jgi:hypothetical protein
MAAVKPRAWLVRAWKLVLSMVQLAPGEIRLAMVSVRPPVAPRPKLTATTAVEPVMSSSSPPQLRSHQVQVAPSMRPVGSACCRGLPPV